MGYVLWVRSCQGPRIVTDIMSPGMISRQIKYRHGHPNGPMNA